MTGRRTVQLGDFLAPVKEPVTVQDGVTYKQVTVRIKGNGLALRGEELGEKIGTKRQYRVRAGNWLASKIDARNGGMGLVPEYLDGAIVTQDFPAFEIDETVCIPGFFDALTRRHEFWDECLLASEGSTNRVRLNVPEFLELDVDLPPLDDQRRITAALAALTATAQNASREASDAWALLASAVEVLLRTDADWADLPSGWRLAALADVSDVRSGITKGRKTRDPLRPLPFVRAANVQSGFLDLRVMKEIEVTEAEAARFALRNGDVLMIEGGNAEHLGRGWIWEGEIEKCLHQNHVFRARPDEAVVLPRFLAYAVNASPARAYCLENAKRTTNLASINKTQISAMPIPIPPLAAQRPITQRLDTLRRAAVTSQRAAEAADVMRRVTADELLSGDRRVPDRAAA